MPEPGERAVRFELAMFGELIAEPSRVAILLALLDGTRRPASELARAAGVTSATGSAHLARLLRGNLVSVEPSGRQRYYRLAGPDVAEALEAVMAALPRSKSPKRLARAPSDLAYARTCYRHLAGEVGVKWLAALERDAFVVHRGDALTLTASGIAWLDEAGIRGDAWPAGKPCLDWTERRFHLGGPLGVALTDKLLARRWLARKQDSRALRVTASGDRQLSRLFGSSALTGGRAGSPR